MRTALYLLLASLTLWCLGVVVYALFVTFGLMATIATLLVPVLCFFIWDAVESTNFEEHRA